MKLLKLSFLVAALALTACSTARMPVGGGIWGDVWWDGTATTNGKPTKQGEACASSILGIVGTGDASIHTARTKAGITQISSVDHHSTNILGFYGTYCTIVRGN